MYFWLLHVLVGKIESYRVSLRFHTTSHGGYTKLQNQDTQTQGHMLDPKRVRGYPLVMSCKIGCFWTPLPFAYGCNLFFLIYFWTTFSSHKIISVILFKVNRRHTPQEFLRYPFKALRLITFFLCILITQP